MKIAYEHLQLIKFLESAVFIRLISEEKTETFFNYHLCELYPPRAKQPLYGAFVNYSIFDILKNPSDGHIRSSSWFYIYVPPWRKNNLDERSGYALRDISTPTNKLQTIRGCHVELFCKLMDDQIWKYIVLDKKIYRQTLAVRFLPSIPGLRRLCSGSAADKRG